VLAASDALAQNIALAISRLAQISQPVSFSGNLGADNTFTLNAPAPIRATLRLNALTGQLSGTIGAPRSATAKLSGIVFQKGNFAAGFIPQLGEIFTLATAQQTTTSSGTDSSGFSKIGGGTLTIGGGNTYSGGSVSITSRPTYSGGTLIISDGTLSNSSNAVFNGSGTTATLGGSGFSSSVLTTGSGPLTLSGSNVLTGGTNVVFSGTIDSPGGLTSGSNGGLSISGGQILVGNVVVNAGNLSVNLIISSTAASKKYLLAPGATITVQAISGGNNVTITIVNSSANPVAIDSLQTVVDAAVAKNETTFDAGSE
jgi:autotransporter-associated beta strand protein